MVGAVMLAVLPAARAAAVEPGLSPAWTGLQLLIMRPPPTGARWTSAAPPATPPSP
jgi:hypothetical protein